ncbi:MAG: hypothetical protein ACR2OE_12060 [Thermomicrobiales bacterium]
MDGLRLGSDFVRYSSPPIVIGVDFGKQRDPTAIVVTEAIKVDRPGLRPEWRFEVRSMERVALNTDYLAVGRRIAEVVRNIEARPVALNQYPPSIQLVLDSSGVGVPGVDIVRDALYGSRARLTAVTFSHGEALNCKSSRAWTVGKGFLLKRLQALLQMERIKLPANHPEAAAMARELQDYEIKIDSDGDMKTGAFRVGSHDDLATALALAVLRDPGGFGLSTA